jgi:hypothetical protein
MIIKPNSAVNQHQEVISSGPNHKKTSFAVFIEKSRVWTNPGRSPTSARYFDLLAQHTIFPLSTWCVAVHHTNSATQRGVTDEEAQ